MKKHLLIVSGILFSVIIGCTSSQEKQSSEPQSAPEVTEKTKKSQKSASEQGLNYAMSTKAQLAKNLMGAIQDNGAANAISFCNVHAYPITDSLAQVYSLNIKRVTDKPRNPNNAANEIELAHIETFKKALADGTEIESIVKETGETVNFYYPIITNGMCLQCHGAAGKEIDGATLSQLNKLYPDDQARDYAINQVRGIWSISWNKES